MEKGSAGIGVVLTLFFLLLFVLIPLNQIVQELHFLNLTKMQTVVATELAGIDCLMNMKSDALSEGNVEANQNMIAEYDKSLIENLILQNCDISPEDIQIDILMDDGVKKIAIYYTYIYKSRFVRPGKFTKQIIVNLVYEVPINN